jgi:hypothetical protein
MKRYAELDDAAQKQGLLLAVRFGASLRFRLPEGQPDNPRNQYHSGTFQ